PRAKHVQHVLARIAAKIGGDCTQGLSQVLRMPGTMYRVDGRYGKPPVPCTLVSCDSQLRYPFSDFERLATATADRTISPGVAVARCPQVDQSLQAGDARPDDESATSSAGRMAGVGPSASPSGISEHLDQCHGIKISPGRKGTCPFCRHDTFSVRKDDT